MVASEVRSLATKSKENTKQIEENLQTFSKCVATITEYIDQQVGLVQELGHCFKDIKSNADTAENTAHKASQVSENMRKMGNV